MVLSSPVCSKKNVFRYLFDLLIVCMIHKFLLECIVSCHLMLPFWLQRGLMALLDVEGVPVHLGEIMVENLMASWQSVQDILLRHYSRQILHELYKVNSSIQNELTRMQSCKHLLNNTWVENVLIFNKENMINSTRVKRSWVAAPVCVQSISYSLNCCWLSAMDVANLTFFLLRYWKWVLRTTLDSIVTETSYSENIFQLKH